MYSSLPYQGTLNESTTVLTCILMGLFIHQGDSCKVQSILTKFDLCFHIARICSL